MLGDPVVGKTALLDTATTAFAETGDRVLRAAHTAARAGRVLPYLPRPGKYRRYGPGCQLGITSRAALRVALAALPAREGS
jgi:hypothetical protein